MPWMDYKKWSGAVNGRYIRRSAGAGQTISCYGKSALALSLRPPFIGKIINIIADLSRKPSYVRFTGNIDFTYAAEVLIEKSKNSEVFWKDFHNIHMGDEEYVVIKRSDLDKMEIEYQ